jgi:small subunit ribosomal protein S1
VKLKVKSQKSKVTDEFKEIEKKRGGREPETMEELLAAVGSGLKVYKRGDTVKGKITEIVGKSIFVDIGGKGEAMVADREFEAAKEMIKGLKVGDTIEAMISVPEGESGQMLLSLRQAASDKRWEDVEKLAKSGDTVEVMGKEVTKGGLLVELEGLVGFVPGSQLGREWSGRAEELAGKKFGVVVLEADRGTNRLVFSEKAVSETEELLRKKVNLGMVKVGEEHDGIVTGVMPFGIFVRIKVGETGEQEGLEGLVHISELSWSKVADPKALFKEGDGVRVKVIGIEEDSGRLALSIKQLQADPWQAMAKKYPVESKVGGKVTRLASFGAFVELPGGIEGLLHISKIPAEMLIKPGDEVECFVESVDMEKRRLGLGLVLKAKPMMYK